MKIVTQQGQAVRQQRQVNSTSTAKKNLQDKAAYYEKKEALMSDYLNPGDYVSGADRRFRVLKEIGGGGQGNVYLVTSDGEQFALKWYSRQASTAEQYHAIEGLAMKGAPSDRFIWPIMIVEGESKDNFGYIMPLIDTKKYTKLAHYFSGEIKVKRMELIIEACIQMASGFYDLHLTGMCYRDISFGNLFVDFSTGDVLICDNDNVTFDNLTSSSEIWGTQGFMAPEVVKGEAPPSSQTDLFSLSVVLFRMLHLQHPLQGKKEYEIEIADYEALVDLYGHNPIFIYDPIDATNRPVKGKKDMAEAYWHHYPTFIKNRFIEAFTIGLHDPNSRVRESIWIQDFLTLKSNLMYCYHCGSQLFYDRETINQTVCPSCGKRATLIPPRIKIGSRILLLNHDTLVTRGQVESENFMDYETPYLKVEIHPRHPEIWGLKNLSEDVWRYEGKDGQIKELTKDGIVPIKDGLEIYMGEKQCAVRAATQIK